MTRRPASLDLALALVFGVALALSNLGQGALALMVLVVGGLIVALLQRRVLRRLGRILDERAVGAHAWRYAVIFTVIVLLTMVQPAGNWRPWWALVVGLGAGTLTYAGLRWDARYQERRLADGDHGPFDLA